MKIENLRLKGFIGIQRGLGLNEISIDFSKTSGLIALDGVNGSGKSTVLENLHAYPQLASREGALFRHVCSRKAEKELSFSYAGHSYRTLLKIDSQSERSEGYVWKNGVSEVNGKIRDYGKYVQALLGSPELFFSSVFCAQNSRKLSDMTTGELKGLFAEFLRLDRLATWEETAKQAGNILNGKISTIDIRRAGLADRLDGKVRLDLKLIEGKTGIEELETKMRSIIEDVQSWRNRVEELTAIISKNAIAFTQKQGIQGTINRLTTELTRAKQTAETELETVRVRYRELKAEQDKCDSVLKDRENILAAADQEKIAAAENDGLTRAIEIRAEDLSKHQEAIHALERKILELKQEIKDLDNDPLLREMNENLTELTRKREEKGRTIEALKTDPEAHDLELRIKHLYEQSQALDRKDPACTSSICSFILGAIKASAEIPGLEQKFNERDVFVVEAIKDKQAEIEAIADQFVAERTTRDLRVAAIETAGWTIAEAIHGKNNELMETRMFSKQETDAMASDRQSLIRIRERLVKMKELSSRKSEVEVAEARKADLSDRLREIEDKGKTIKATWQDRETGLNAEIDCAKAELAGTEKLIDAAADANLTQVQEQLRRTETETIPALESEITAGREILARIRGEIERMQESERELEAVNADRAILAADVSEWLYLKQACGKNGLQAMEIDGAAPLIAEYANNLLASAFGPLFSINFSTQDEEGREVLDIMVINENGDEDLLENKSGGEKTWILKALRLAMTLLSKEKSGRAFETFLSDEEDGALDMENAKNFIRLYRGCMDVGRFQNGIFISHKQECRGMADHVLAFEPGKNPAWR